MKEFKVEITETLSKIVEIQANDVDEALEAIKEMYYKELIILDSRDFVDKEINMVNNE